MRCVPRILLCILVTAAFLAAAGPAGAGVDVPRVNRGAGLDIAGTVQNETALIQNKPTYPNNIVIAHNDDSDGIGQVGPDLGISYTLDGGATWMHSHISMPGAMSFDPSITADTSGNLYAIAVNDTAPMYQPPVAIYIHKSTDRGATWPQNIKIRTFDPSSIPPPPNRYLDKPWVTTDMSTGSPYTNNIYVVWQEDDLVNVPVSWIYFAKTTPSLASPTLVQVTEATRANPYDNGPVVATAPNGDIYVAWLDTNIVAGGQLPGSVRLRKSTNGGTSFFGPGNPTGSTVVANFTTVPKYPLGSGPYRQVSFPSIAADPTNSNNVYVVYAADPDGVAGIDDGNAYFTRSNDGGVTWSTPIIVNNDGTAQGQFQPWIDVKPNGYIDIVWMDARNDPGLPPNTVFDIYMATSTNGGTSFVSNTRVSDQSFNVRLFPGSNVWVGEYPGLDVDSSNAYIAWTGVTWTGGVGDPDIWFDTMPNPQNTTTGSHVRVAASKSVKAKFTSVTASGDTTATVEGLPDLSPPSGYKFIAGGLFDLSTTAAYSGDVEVQFEYDPASVGAEEAQLRLFHWTGTSWEDATYSVDTASNFITGTVASLSPFALVLPAGTPIVAVGYSKLWLVWTAVSLTLAGGLFFVKRRRRRTF